MHVLTSQGIISITVPDELPTLLRDFTKDVIRARPTNLVQYAAAYFSALAGGISGNTFGGPYLQTSAQHSIATAPSNDAISVAKDQPPENQLWHGSISEPTAQDPQLVTQPGASAASERNLASAAWRVSGEGEVLAPPPLLSQLYAGRRTSDHNLQPAQIDSSDSASPKAAAAAWPLQQQAGNPAATAEIDQMPPEPAVHDGEPAATSATPQSSDDAGSGIVAKDEWEEALVSMAERLFREADADGSGALDRKEFRNVMRNIELGLSTTQVRALMAEADENEDGFVDWREFLPALLPLLQSLEAAKEVAAEHGAAARARAEEMLQAEMPQEVLEGLMRELFRTADSDGSGALSRAEFKACLRSESAAGLKLSRQDINTLLTEVDADGNGLVDYEEFIPIAYNILVERLTDSLLKANTE